MGGPIPIMRGACHGDLHVGNLLVTRDEVAGGDDDFWIVDMDQARSSIIGFDLAYLEISVLVNFHSAIRAPMLARCLEAAEDVSVTAVPDNCGWLVEVLRRSRAGIEQWLDGQRGLSDDMTRQFILARIVVALLWARRFPGTDGSRTCLAYAGWYAMRYRKMFPNGHGPEGTAEADDAQLDEGRRALWDSLWGTVSGFAPHAARYVLIAEQLPRQESTAALGRVPWSLVVDLDPVSDGDGLRHLAGPVLDAQRAVHVISGDELPVVDYSRGTAWLLSDGSVLRREASLTLREWSIRRLGTIRKLATSFRQAAGETPVIVVVLEGGVNAAEVAGTARDRLLRVIDTMDEMLLGRASFLHVGLADLQAVVPVAPVPLPVSAFLDLLAETLGSSAEYQDFGLPALGRSTVAVSPETMQKFREHLVVLHDGIADSSSLGDRQNDLFWRGGLVGWPDLDAGLDVVRSVNVPLVAALRASLDQHRTRTVVLEHRPGAGGTTAALRAAWDLHHENPVAVLLNGVPVDAARVPLIADRLHRLYIITQLPVLLVAEAGDLSEAYRELLYRELAARNARVTILYVRRVVGQPSKGPLLVSEPLDAEETEQFHRQYVALVSDSERVHELMMLRSDQYARFRTPFFYGLITFEREFTKLTDFVRTHIDQVRGRARDVLAHLALVTIYSNTGLQIEAVQRLMRVMEPSAEVDLADLLGPEAARLIAMRSGRLRLQHQLLAEQVLAEIVNDPRWENHLKDLSVDLIQALHEVTDMSSEPIRLVLRQMFVERQGGTADGVEDRKTFSPLIEKLDLNSAHQVLKTLTEHVPEEPHFWNHLGRHQMYRLNRELDKAEDYVARAVELAPEDFLHYHTLGLARRSRMRQDLQDARRRGIPGIMAAADRWFAQTVECFATARELNPEGIYGYITHVQAIVDVAKVLKSAARVPSVAELSADAGDWIAEHLADANELLDTAKLLYGTLDRKDNYLTRCLSDIQQLYGDLDSVVELWEVAVAGRRSTPMVQRSLAQAYYVRAGRSWRGLSRSELQRIVELAGQNLSRVGSTEEDFRLWFEAYTLLPEFDIDEALSQLKMWSARFPSWRSHYYQYCLQFHLWFGGRADGTEAFRVEQQEAKKHAVGRSSRSYLWLATNPDWCPLIAESDLGDWNRKANFWSSTSHLLRLNGNIEHMRGPQAGTIRLYGAVTAFFVPAIGGFLPDIDEEAKVNFFLGLSPEGLRAWDVQTGYVADGVFARDGVSREGVRIRERPRVPVAWAAVSGRAAELAGQRKLAFCVALLQAWASVGDAPPLSRLTGRVEARFRDGASGLADLLAASELVDVGSGDDPVIRLAGSAGRPGTQAVWESGESGEPGRPQPGRITFVKEPDRRGLIELTGDRLAGFKFDDIVNPAADNPVRGQIVRVAMVTRDRSGSPNARGVELLPLTATLVADEVVPQDQLRARVEADLRAELDDRLADGVQRVPTHELGQWLRDRFVGCQTLEARLGLTSLREWWRQLDWLVLTSEGAGTYQTVRLRSGRASGRVSSAVPDPAVAPASASVTGPEATAEESAATEAIPDFGELLAATVVAVRAQFDVRDPSLGRVEFAIRRALGDRYAEVVGMSLGMRIERQPGWKLRTIPSGLVLVVKDSAAASRPRRSTAPRPTGPAGSTKATGPADATGSTTEAAGPAGHEHVSAADVGAGLEAAVAEMVASGRRPFMSDVGVVLRAKWGAAEYTRIKGTRSLGALVAEHGWDRVDAGVGNWVLQRRPPGAGE